MGIYKIIYSDDYKIEFNLPFLFLIEPDDINKEYSEKYLEIYKNQQTLITSFDIYYTLRYILYGEEYKNSLNGNKQDGKSLFKFIDPKTRTCKKYKQIGKNTCQCH